MKRIALAVILAALATAASAQQNFVTVKPGKEAWWLRASFTPMHTEVRGIPVAKIRRDWCKATEYTNELIPKKLLLEDGKDLMKEYGLSFSTVGNFDRSKTKQIALVGVYQTCGGRKGSFLLVLDEGTKKIRFVDVNPGETQFATLTNDKNDIVMMYCMECDAGDVLRWTPRKKAFNWVQSRGHGD